MITCKNMFLADMLSRTLRILFASKSGVSMQNFRIPRRLTGLQPAWFIWLNQHQLLAFYFGRFSLLVHLGHVNDVDRYFYTSRQCALEFCETFEIEAKAGSRHLKGDSDKGVAR